jgi:prepilin-type N-terminal cleavage/methylation domain-containing protein
MHKVMAPRAFSLTELLVVVAILALLIGLLITGISAVQRTARVTKCLSNQRQIALACASYASSNAGRLVNPRTSRPFDPPTPPTLTPPGCPAISYPTGQSNTDFHSWTASFAPNTTTIVVNGQTVTAELDTAITKGALYPYVGSLPVYKSPLDPGSRVRSYSLSAFIGCHVPDEYSGYISWEQFYEPEDCQNFNTTALSRIQQPSKTIACITEDDNDGYSLNNQGWIIDPTNSNWIDWPAFWDPRNVTYAMVDGSTERYEMTRPELPGLIQTFGHWYFESPVNGTGWRARRDWYHFRIRCLPGNIPNPTP